MRYFFSKWIVILLLSTFVHTAQAGECQSYFAGNLNLLNFGDEMSCGCDFASDGVTLSDSAISRTSDGSTQTTGNVSPQDNNDTVGTHTFTNTTSSASPQQQYSCDWDGSVYTNARASAGADPEPTNSATNAATTGSPTTSTLTVTWTDSVAGSQAATNYLVLCSTAAITNPVDGTAQTDNDCSDGTGALNVSPSTQTSSWTGLSAGTAYFFKIYPYTNTDSDIDYKLSSPASVGATTQKVGLDALAAPTVGGSAMFTLSDICNRLNIGTAGSKRSGAFTEPTAAPAPTDCSLNTIMAKLPVLDDSNGALSSDVAAGKTFWSLKSGVWGLQTGTKP